MSKKSKVATTRDEYKDVEVRVLTVTGRGKIMDIAKDKGINPQNVFVKVTVAINVEGKEIETVVSNQLRFLRKEGYEKLLAAKESGELIKISLRSNEKGVLFYLNRDEDVKIEDLFATPIEHENAIKVEKVFNLLA